MTEHHANLVSREGAHHAVLPLRALRVRVRPDRVEVSVAVSAKRYEETDESLIQAALRYAPTLGQHACRNNVGPVFAFVMKRTSTPHLLEHLVIDAQTRAAKDASRVFTGTTQWSAENELVANVAFSYEDDLVALDALTRSLEFLNRALIKLRG